MIIAIQILSVLGCLISLYFTLVYHRRISASTKWVPRVCRMEEGVCDEIIHTPDARLLGIPNFHLGVVFYLVLFAAPFVFKPFTGVADGFMIAVGISVGTGIYLTHSLVYVLKKKCVLCFTTHSINLIILVLLILYQ